MQIKEQTVDRNEKDCEMESRKEINKEDRDQLDKNQKQKEEFYNKVD